MGETESVFSKMEQKGFQQPPPYHSGTQPQVVNVSPAPVILQPQPQVVQYVVPSFGPDPVQMVCPQCQKTITTRTESQSSSQAFLCCLGLMLIGCDFGCCLIPFCMDSCKRPHTPALPVTDTLANTTLDRPVVRCGS